MPLRLLGLLSFLALPCRADDPLVLTASGHGKAVTSLAFHPNGARLLSGSQDTVTYWEVQSGREIATWNAHDGWVRTVAVSPDGRKALTGGEDNRIRLWDIAGDEKVRVWQGHNAHVRTVVFCPDGRKALSGSADKTLKLWDAATGKALATWTGHTWNVNAVAISPDGRTAASGSLDMSVKFWDVGTGKEIATGLGHSADVLSVAFSPDGKRVLSASEDNTVRLWDAKTGKELAVWEGHRKAVNAVAFSPDGQLAASGSSDYSVKVWEVATGKNLATWKRHISAVNAVAFSPDGAVLVSGGEDETLKFWRIPSNLLAGAEVPKPTAPAKLTAQVSFTEPSGDDALNGEEKGALRVALKNEGTGPAYAVKIMPSHPPTVGLTVPRLIEVGTLRPGQSLTKDVPLEASEALENGKVQIRVEVKEGNGFDAEPQGIEFETRAFVAPKLELAGITLGGGIVRAGEVTQAAVTIRNAGGGAAKGVSAKLAISDTDIFPSGDTSVALGDMGPGESKKAEFQFVVNNRFKGKNLPISVELTESIGKYGASLPLNLALGQAVSSLKVVSVKGKDVAPAATVSQEAAQEDVDTPPETKTELDPDAYAVVIGIEKYRQKGIPAVDFAARDAQSVYDYLTRAMGFDEKNVALLRNDEAGKTDIEKYLGPWLQNRVSEKSRVFIYYAGHGAPNPVSGEGYLIPYDGDPNYTDIAAYPVKRLYEALAKLPTKNVTVVLDACFSGQGTRSLIAKGTRPMVNVAPTGAGVGANTVVMTATGGSQISTYYPDGQHGLLTYYLLKGLRGEADAGKKGRVTTADIFNYLKPMVEREAKKQNVSQTPTLNPPLSELGDRAREVWLRTK